MPIEEIKKVCFIGAGTMGCFNSLWTSIFGYPCVVYDISAEALERAPARQRELGALVVAQGKLTQELLDVGLSRVTYTTNISEAVQGADLVSESVPEKLSLKRETHRQLDEICAPETILTTNTSYLLVSEIEDVVKRGDRFAALHFHLGAPLLDIVGGPRTSSKTIDALKRFAASIMQTAVTAKKEKDGYLFNSIIFSMFKTALNLVADGYADFMDVDRAYMAALSQFAGPFGSMDYVGLDIILHTIESQGLRRDPEGCEKAATVIRPLVESGNLGYKTGKGFYTYPNPAFQQPDFLFTTA
jgi:3-hydroxybutyryl-CoA dehydrogenase